MNEQSKFLKRPDGSFCTPEDYPEFRKTYRKILNDNFYGEGPVYNGIVAETPVFTESFADGKGIFEKTIIHFGPDQSLDTTVRLMRPAKEGSYRTVVMPAMLVPQPIAELAVRNNTVIAAYDPTTAVPDGEEWQNDPLYKAYPGYSWRVIAMWAWEMSRVIDWLETKAFVNMEQLCAAGHSRYGKTAICCAVNDDRVKACAPAGSGCGGMGSLRIGGGRLGEKTEYIETLGMVCRSFPQWFKEELKEYGKAELNGHYREEELPFDSDMMGAAIAPRPLLIMEGLDDAWSNPYGTFKAWWSINDLYRDLGVQEQCAIHFREGGHSFSIVDWTVLLDFLQVVFEQKEKETEFKVYPPTDDFGKMMERAYKPRRMPDKWLFEK